MNNFSIELVWAKIQIAITALGGWLGYFLGGTDGMLIALIVFVTMDYITGDMCAGRLEFRRNSKSALPTGLAESKIQSNRLVDKKLSSAVGFKGIFKKVLIFALVGIGHILDLHVIGAGSALRTAVICFYLSNEGLSLIENAAHFGLPIPDKLKDILAQLHNRSDKDNTSAKLETTDKGDGE